MKQKIRIIAADIDGTLVNQEKKVTPRTRAAIQKVRACGMRFGISSGRPIRGLHNNIPIWGLENEVDFIIGSNGAQMYDCRTKKTEEYFKLTAERIFEILDLYEPFDFNPCVYTEDTAYTHRIDSTIERVVKNNQLKLELCNLKDVIVKPQNKLIMVIPDGRMEEVEQFYAAHPSKDYRAFKSQADMFEFVDIHLSKAYGIEQYCRKYGDTLDHVLAFGDTSNDLEMIRDCGIGVCMANGTDDVKAVADAVALSNDEDGLACYLEEYVLKSS